MKKLSFLKASLREPPYILAGNVFPPHKEVEVPLALAVQVLHVPGLVRLVYPWCRRLKNLLSNAVRLADCRVYRVTVLV